jgi:renalase
MLPTTESCIIVGAGLSGLVAAQTLQDAGVRVTILEAEDKVGGRMRTDRVGGGVFDHGAQFFTARGDRFTEMVEAWQAAGVAAVWSRGFADADGNKNEDGYPRYMGVGGMTAIAEHLSRGLDVRTGVEVRRICAHDGGWKTVAEGEEYGADALVLAMPAPPALDLVNGSGVALPSEARRDLENIVYQPCIGVLAVLGGEGGVPEPGGVQIGGEPLFFVSDNRRKGISEKTALTIHASPEFSREHAHTDDARVTQLLLEAAKDYLDSSEVEETTVYRWVYSMPAEPHGEKFVYVDVPPPLLFCGDAYGGPKVEGAVMSGRAAAEKLLGAW